MFCRILIVDDDPSVLAALRRELLRPPHIGTDGIEVETFASANAALSRIGQADADFDVAIVDYHMPEINGIALLDYLRELRPDTLRILLTGAIDVDGAVAAINSARVDHLLTKPWYEFDLKGRIALALHMRELQRHADPTKPATPIAGPPYRLLLLDDEPHLLRALERELSMHGRTTGGARPLFDISSATSAAAALALAEATPPDLIISDYAMASGDGVQLLYQMRQRHPQCARILMSAFARLDTLKDAINVAGVYHFIGKPWEAAALRATVAEALMYRQIVLG